MGVVEAPAASSADDVLKQIMQRAAFTLGKITREAELVRWPFVARYFYFERAWSNLDNMLPLAVLAKRAAFHQNALRNRWAHAVLYGPWQGRRPPLAPHAVTMLLSDLAWDPLWDATIVKTISLLQRFNCGDPDNDHVKLTTLALGVDTTWCT